MVTALFALKKGEKKEVKKESKKVGTKSRGRTVAELRLQTEMTELDKDLDPCMQLTFPDVDNIMEFYMTIKIEDKESPWYLGTYKFQIKVPTSYPFDPPHCLCLTKIYHPNISLEGNVCLNILRMDWKPIFCITTVLIGLRMLFLEPNPNDPLNQEAAAVMQTDPALFKNNVRKSLKGYSVDGHSFPRLV